MRGKLVAGLQMSFVITALVGVAAAGGFKAPKNVDNRTGEAKGLQDVSFSLTPLVENPGQYSLVISDTNERTISGSFSVNQLQILRALMVEAEKFALTSEAAGAKDSTTTRFMDKHEAAFVVDVQKDSSQSRLYITLKTEIGRGTWEAGRTIRSTRREDGFFFDLLSRLESLLPKPPAQPK
jgi:DNA-binding MarR family transcriptional regulator